MEELNSDNKTQPNKHNKKSHFCFKKPSFQYFIHFSFIFVFTVFEYSAIFVIFSILLTSVFIIIRILINRITEPDVIVLPKIKIRDRKGGWLKIGKIISNNRKVDYRLRITDLEKHMFVSGLTGMGKTNFIQVLIMELIKNEPQIPFLVGEFKGEYDQLLSNQHGVEILAPGRNFRLNIFDPKSEDVEVYAEKLLNLMISCQMITLKEDYSAQMEKVLSDVLISVCSDEKRRNWEGFDYYLTHIKQAYRYNTPYIEQTVVSIENRIRRLKQGPLRNTFTSEEPIDTPELKKKNTIIDLSEIIKLGGSKDDAVFFANVLFNAIWVENLEHGKSESIRHITIVEDSIFFSSKSENVHGLRTNYVEDIALLLRGTGECLININTRPTISEDIMANAGVVVSFQLSYDQQQMGRLLALQKNQYFYLTQLQTGQCIIKANSVKTPFMLQIPKIDESIIGILNAEEASPLENIDNSIYKKKKNYEKKDVGENGVEEEKMNQMTENNEKVENETNNKNLDIRKWQDHLADCENLFLIGQYDFCLKRCHMLYIAILRLFKRANKLNQQKIGKPNTLIEYISKKSKNLANLLANLEKIDHLMIHRSSPNEKYLERYLSLLKKIFLIIKVHHKDSGEFLEIADELLQETALKTPKIDEIIENDKMQNTSSEVNSASTKNPWQLLERAIIQYENQEPK